MSLEAFNLKLKMQIQTCLEGIGAGCFMPGSCHSTYEAAYRKICASLERQKTSACAAPLLLPEGDRGAA